MITLKDIMLRCDPEVNCESYLMTDYDRDKKKKDRTLIVKRVEMTFNEINCQMFNFTDITTYKLLKQEEETSRLLQALNTSAHHEMLGPLKTNIDISTRLVKKLKDKDQRKMC